MASSRVNSEQEQSPSWSQNSGFMVRILISTKSPQLYRRVEPRPMISATTAELKDYLLDTLILSGFNPAPSFYFPVSNGKVISTPLHLGQGTVLPVPELTRILPRPRHLGQVFSGVLMWIYAGGDRVIFVSVQHCSAKRCPRGHHPLP